ncbi:cold-shock protein [Streptomyces mirabilis]|uniref:cold-shock protein n=1 Tax=Streptomyces mirabilis TaxID=68239 RepID=UPI00342C63D1
MATSTVKWFNDAKGFGLIIPDEGARTPGAPEEVPGLLERLPVPDPRDPRGSGMPCPSGSR